jgi:hypothetical protein
MGYGIAYYSPTTRARTLSETPRTLIDLALFFVLFNGFVALESYKISALQAPEQLYQLTSWAQLYFITNTGHNTFIFKKNQTLRYIYINFLQGREERKYNC